MITNTSNMTDRDTPGAAPHPATTESFHQWLERRLAQAAEVGIDAPDVRAAADMDETTFSHHRHPKAYRSRGPTRTTVTRLARAFNYLFKERHLEQLVESEKPALRPSGPDDARSRSPQRPPRSPAAAAVPPEHPTQIGQRRPRTRPGSRSARKACHNLTRPRDSFFGREEESNEIWQLIGDNRLVTLIGTGGVGKTRLAIEIGLRWLAENIGDGAKLVDLGHLQREGPVAEALAEQLRVSPQSAPPGGDSFLEYLSERELLLILDNCEHVASQCAPPITQILGECPNVRILATSREPLRLAGEKTLRISPLAIPDAAEEPEPESLGENPSVQLFCDRASAVPPAFVLTKENAPTVARICRRLEGLPLAIELAAAHVRSLAVGDIDKHLSLYLDQGRRDALPRHQTLQSTFEWSCDLLSPKERDLLFRLSVFAGGWDLDSAAAVCPGDEINRAEVIALIPHLAEKSLVVAEQRGESTRFHMLETLRQYAFERLMSKAEADEIRDAQRDWALGIAQRERDRMEGELQLQAIERLKLEHANLQAALDWTLQDGRDVVKGLELCVSLAWYWLRLGFLREGSRCLLLALSESHSSKSELYANALGEAGRLAEAQGEYDTARRLHEECLGIFRTLGVRHGEAMAIYNLARLELDCGKYSVARRLCEESLESFRTFPDPAAEARALGVLGLVAIAEGNVAAARPLIEQCLQLSHERGNVWGVHRALWGLGVVAAAEGDPDTARENFVNSLRASLAYGDLRGIAQCLEGIAGLSIKRGDPSYGVTLLGAAKAIRSRINFALTPAAQLEYDQHVADARQQLTDDFDRLLKEGRHMTPDAAVTYALDGLPAAPIPGDRPPQLGRIASAISP